MINSLRRSIFKKPFSSAFTIIELLIVIAVIGILATISAVSYVGIKDKVIESTIKSQLTSAADNLKSFRNKNGNYPITIDCSIVDSGVNLCLKSGDDASYTYRVDDESNPQSFSLYATSSINNKIYSITDSSTVSKVAAIPAEPIKWKQISAGETDTCAIASDNQVYCWGFIFTGSSLIPIAVDTSDILSGKTIKSVSTTSDHNCVIASDNQAYCWGWNGEGQLGDNSTNDSYVPVAVYTSEVLSDKTIESIDIGYAHSCVIASDNQAYCWGYNYSGQLGNNSTTDSSVPVAVYTTGVLNGKTIKSISLGDYHACVIASDNKAYCWGYNNYGQLGNSTTTDSLLVPIAVDMSGVLNGKTINSISLGNYSSCVIASDNKAYCWGYNNYGQLGNNSANSFVFAPVAVDTTGVLNGKTIKSISVGLRHTCAIASDNKAYCWGNNSSGQLGNNSTTDSSVPVAVDTTGVLNGKTIISIGVGFGHTCAIASDNKAYCWGYNDNGQLGNNSTTKSSVPVQVAYPNS